MQIVPLLQGLFLGGGLIVAIGAQNAYVIRTGVRGRHVFAVTTTCFLIDAGLIWAGAATNEVEPLRDPALVHRVEERYLRDDEIVFRMIDDAPFTEGKQAVIDGIGPFLSNLKSARFEMLRSVAMGNIVVNDRIDHFGKEDGSSNAYHITGVFKVKNGKIVEWRDYMMPTG